MKELACGPGTPVVLVVVAEHHLNTGRRVNRGLDEVEQGGDKERLVTTMDWQYT